MLRINPNKSPAKAKSYFTVADYFAPGQQELKGVWRGKGAARLGLEGEIAQKDWDALCENRNPATGEKLTVRQKSERRVGFDFNWHVPKSVSLLYGLTGDERILDAFQKSVHETMCEIESETKARVRMGGKNEDRLTSEMVWGEHIHLTARPIEGTPDPHLHCHCFVQNQTFDPVEKRWKAVQIAEIKRDAPLFEARFHARMSKRMADLGLVVTRTKNGWDLEGISALTREKFSRRTTEIEKVAAELGITDARKKAELGASTREHKQKDLSMEVLRKCWLERMTHDEQQSIAKLVIRIGTAPVHRDAQAPERAAKLAIEHCFERRSVVPERTLLAEALKRVYGEASVELTEEAVRRQDIVTGEREGRRLTTTPLVLLEEKRMLDYAREGRGACDPLVAGIHEIRHQSLNAEQRAAVRHILESRDRIVLVSGGAGTGKTTMVAEAVGAIQAGGRRVFAFAPSADASRGVLRIAGFKDADTVAMLLKDQALQETVRGNVIWIDEASLMGSRTMRQVVDLCDRLDARLLLTGDNYQHHSVERGSTLRLLQTEAGLVPAELKVIQRQDGDYREAVKSLANGRIARGLEQLDDLGWIKEVPDEERYQSIARDYADAIANKQSALVVSPTHHEGRLVTAAIRSELKRNKQLSGDDREWRVLHNANLTTAQRAEAVNFNNGDTILFHQNATGFRRGQRLVAGECELPLKHAEHYTVFRPGKLSLAAGDVIRITHNGKTRDGRHRLDNGSIFTIRKFTKGGDILLTNGWTISHDFGHLAHGYAMTSQASQGKTVDAVFIAMSSASFPAASREGLYVAASRGRDMARIYTDDREALFEAVHQTEDRLSATEFVNDRHDHRAKAIDQMNRRRQAVRQREPSVPARKELTYER